MVITNPTVITTHFFDCSESNTGLAVANIANILKGTTSVRHNAPKIIEGDEPEMRLIARKIYENTNANIKYATFFRVP